MLIRSQSKYSLIVLDNAKAVRIEERHKAENGCYYVVRSQYGENEPNRWAIIADEDFLGEYSTEAKAIKVLDMICDAYELCERTDYQNIGYVGNGVFQMPQESEV